jgi:hypothetical protein
VKREILEGLSVLPVRPEDELVEEMEMFYLELTRSTYDSIGNDLCTICV